MMDAQFQREANVNLTQKFVEGLTPSARGAGHGAVALETVPYSLWMLSAGHGSFSLNRAVSSLGILSKSEKVAFDSHVATLRSLGLTYVANEEGSMKLHNERSGHVTMRLEPQIDRLVHYEELSVPPENRRKQVPSVVSSEEQ
jgi:chromosome transmission fidelity protein 18